MNPMYYHGIPLAGSSMYHNGLGVTAHLGSAQALAAAAIVAAVTAGGLAVRRLRRAAHRS